MEHAAYLKRSLFAAFEQDTEQKQSREISRTGTYLDFQSESGATLPFESLERISSGIRLLNVRKEVQENQEEVTYATVFVPRDQGGHFFRFLDEYATQTTETGNPKNAPVVSKINAIQLAYLESFWQDKKELLPGDTAQWVEVWLSTEELDVIADFRSLCRRQQIKMSPGEITFPERTVLLLLANRENLLTLIRHSNSIAEIRAGKAVVDFFLDESPADQAKWAQELLSRTDFQNPEDVAVLVLDTGVNNGHILLSPVLNNQDLHTVDAAWQTFDHNGHGTLMAGTAAYGDIAHALQSSGAVTINHIIESAKILPNSQNDKTEHLTEDEKGHLWGNYTAQGIYLAEIQAPHRKRIICMAVSSNFDGERGRPSSWSGKLDEVTSGYSDDVRRLMIVAAGNVTEEAELKNYPDSNLTHEVHDPAQAWNVLSVGAFTNKVTIGDDPMWDGWEPMADAGALSPYSSTSVTWENWPIKPEILLEGGNIARRGDGSIDVPGNLQLLSTFHHSTVKQFYHFNQSSAATAQAACMAAKIQAAYPKAWPETIRGLMVHSAEWTEAQMNSFDKSNLKTHRKQMLRTYGYGVPNLERALYCASNSLTLVVQEEMQPFDKNDNGGYATKDMHLHRLPWPVDVLRSLGETVVKMRITLSYFVEPSPGSVGWKDRYRYASHILRFQLNGSGESEDEFVQRINTKARDEEEREKTASASPHWFLGSQVRDVGSIHSDIWEGTASELANSHLIAVHPATGWWRTRPHLKKWDKMARYALLVSLHLPEQEVDIYTPVATQVGIATPVVIPIAV